MDITMTGSLIGWGEDESAARREAAHLSKVMVGRLIRVHGVDGVSVIAEYRDGRALELV